MPKQGTEKQATKNQAQEQDQNQPEETKEKRTKATGNSFKGEYVQAVGRRKRSVAQVRLFKGRGAIVINGKDIEDYFDADRVTTILQPLKLTSHLKDLDFSVVVKGGGVQGQAEAIRLGISKTLSSYDSELTTSLKAKGWLTRDSRMVERKKPGLKKARRAPQWSKR